MSQQGLRSVKHTVDVAAPPEVPYRIIADVTRWPYLFPPTIHAERVHGGHAEEIIQIWAFADGKTRTWTSRRRLDPAALRVTFEQQKSVPPVSSMGGSWQMLPATGGGARVVLGHDFAAIDGDETQADWIESVVDRNSGAELAGLKAAAELNLDELLFTFDDTVQIRGTTEAAYDYLYRCDLWPERLPHVASLRLVEDEPGIQVMTMDTRAPDGSTHTTKSVRICFPHREIVYKQTVLPQVMAAHTGNWQVRPVPDGVEVTSRHTVLLRPETFDDLIGPRATAADARKLVRHSLGTNSRTTLEHARAYVENSH